MNMMPMFYDILILVGFMVMFMLVTLTCVYIYIVHMHGNMAYESDTAWVG